MLFFLIFVSIFTFLIWNQFVVRRKLPRGPLALPFIGNLPQILYHCWKTGGVVEAFNEIRKQYGKVFTLWFGPLPTVFIADYDVAYETHVKRANTFGVRYSKGGLNAIRNGKGIVGSNGEFWSEHRRFALTTLKNFGVGRNLMEERIMEEYKFRFEDFTKTHFKNGGIEVDAGSCFDLLVGSIINMLLISERFEQDNQEFELLKDNLTKAFRETSVIDSFTPSWLLKSKLWKWRTETTLAPFHFVYDLAKRGIQKRVASIENGTHVMSEEGDDFVDAFLIRMEKDEKDDVIDSSFNLDTLEVDLFDLWIAGQETTATTFKWALACLLNHPEVVEELRRELVQITGGNRNVSLTDRTKTPYLNATVNEIQRVASIMNTNLFRVLEEDTVIDGQPVCAGAAVTAQLSMLHTNEDVYKNPSEFNPKRFLENNNLEKTVIPFGIGKRACPGEALARAELYLITGNIVLEYHLEPIGPIPEIKTTSPFGFWKRPPNFDIRFVPIQH